MTDKNANYIDGLVKQNAKLKDDVKILRQALYDLYTAFEGYEMLAALDIGIQEQVESALRETKGFYS